MFLGMGPIGQHTLEWAMPVISFVAGFVLWGLLRMWRGEPRLSIGLFWGLLCVPLFVVWLVVINVLVGSYETCTFDSEMISFYTSHGSVLGLEDARYGQGLVLVSLFLWGVYILIGGVVVSR
jgi:hypothetical protein